MQLINSSYIENSQSYSILYPLAPGILDALGNIIPFFKGAIMQLQDFFQKQAF
jgi:hypothetical protein